MDARHRRGKIWIAGGLLTCVFLIATYYFATHRQLTVEEQKLVGTWCFSRPENSSILHVYYFDRSGRATEEHYYLTSAIRHTTLLFPSGERWSYSNTGYTLLAAIVERVTGEIFEEYLRRALLWPLGMHDTGYVFPPSERARVARGYIGSEEWRRPVDQTERPSWNLIGNGGLHSTMSDLLLWKTAFCSMQSPAMRPRSPDRRVLVDQEANIWSDYGAFSRETDAELGTVIYHNGSNSVFSATIRWFPQIDRYMAITSSQSDVSAMSIARTICDCWTPSQTSPP